MSAVAPDVQPAHEWPAFYFVRHATTALHEEKRLVGGGRLDPPLSEQGLREARALASRLHRAKLGVRAIVSSSLLRAVQTADVLHDRIPVKMVAYSALRERDLGEWEGQELSRLPDGWREQELPPGGESRVAFEARVRAGLGTALALPGPVLLVGHLYVSRAIFTFLGLEPVKVGRANAWRFEPGSPWRATEI